MKWDNMSGLSKEKKYSIKSTRLQVPFFLEIGFFNKTAEIKTQTFRCHWPTQLASNAIFQGRMNKDFFSIPDAKFSFSSDAQLEAGKVRNGIKGKMGNLFPPSSVATA